MAFPPPSENHSLHLPLPDPEAYPDEPREYARALMQRKDDIDGEISELNRFLASHNATSNTPLIDPEGFPRADIDIYAIRHARSTLVRLINDRIALTSLISTALEAAFAPGPSQPLVDDFKNPEAKLNGHAPAVDGQKRESGSSDLPDIWPEPGIARVNSVANLSPAEESGLRAGDIIHSFSGVTAVSTNGGLQAIGSLVQRSEGATLTILITRTADGNSQRLRLRLTPRNGWGGRGMLGCHILPL